MSVRSMALGLCVAWLAGVALGATPDRYVVAVLDFRDRATLAALAERLDIWEVDHAACQAVVQMAPDHWDFVRSLGVEPDIDEARTAELNAQRALGIGGYPCYRTVAETYATLDTLAATHPTLVQVQVIGQSWDKFKAGGPAGHDLKVMILGNRTNVVPKFRFFLMSEIHAREYATAEMALRFSEQLLAGYGTDPDATWLLDHGELHVVVMTNPDGRLFAEAGQSWRKNTDNDDGAAYSYGTDLNRNSSFKWNTGGSSGYPDDETYRGPSAASEPETQAVEAYMRSIFADQRGPSDGDAAPADATGLMISLHSYSELVLYPWGSSSAPAPNETGLRVLGRKFGFFNRYEVSQSIGLYPTSGTTDDWAYGTLGIAAYTFEIGTSFFQSCSSFESTLLPGNLAALRFAFKAARRPYQTPSGPEVTALAAAPGSPYRGDPVTLTGTADDTRSYTAGGGAEPAQAVAAARVHADAPSWAGGSAIPLTLTGSGTSVRGFTGTVNTTGLTPGRHLLFVEAQDTAGNWGVPTAVFVNVLPPSNAAPSVALTAPSNGAVITLPAAVNLAATAGDSDGTVTKVEFYAGATKIGEDMTAPHTFTWPASAGHYTLTAVAQDDDGAHTTSAPVTITVIVPPAPPTVALTAPANGAVIVLPNAVTFAATAGDSDGTIAKVEFYLGATRVGVDNSAPYAFSWLAAAGTYTLTAVAQDNTGLRTTSAPAGITVTPVLPTPAITLADNGPQVGAGNVTRGASAHVLHTFKLTVATASATLNAVAVGTAGSHDADDLSNLKLWLSSDATFGGDTLVGTMANPGVPGLKTFVGLAQVLPVGERTFFVTADVAAQATTPGSVSVGALDTGALTFAAGAKSGGPTTAGGAQQIVRPLTDGNLVAILVDGNGAALGADAALVRVNEYTPAGGLVNSFVMPQGTVGARLTLSGNAPLEGKVTISPNGKYLALAGYNVAENTAHAGQQLGRTLARLTVASAEVNLSTVGGLGGNNTARSAAVDDTGTGFWYAASDTSSPTPAPYGLAYVGLGQTTAGTSLIGHSDVRGARLFGGNLYEWSDSSNATYGANYGLYQVGTGLPTTGAQPRVGLPGLAGEAAIDCTGFFLADLNAAEAGYDTLWMARGAYGVTKGAKVGGVWRVINTLDPGDVQHLDVALRGTTAEIYIVEDPAAGASRLMKLTDAGGYNAVLSGAFVELAGDGADQCFRGVVVIQTVAPTPDIRVNDSDSQVTLRSSDMLSATVDLNPGVEDGRLADWFVLAHDATRDVWHQYVPPFSTDSWQSWDGSPTTQQPLAALPPYEVLRISGLGVGSYHLYFGVDLNPNGILDFDTLYHDSVDVEIVP